MGRYAKSMMKAVWNKIRVCVTANVCVTWPSEETDPTFSKARECVRVYTRTIKCSHVNYLEHTD